MFEGEQLVLKHRPTRHKIVLHIDPALQIVLASC